MTAYARAQQSNEFGEIVIELRSVNHRYLETSFRLPEDFKAKEADFKKVIAQYASRGKIELSLRYSLIQKENNGLQLDEDKIKQLMQAEQQVLAITQGGLGLKVADILNWPGVITEASKDTSALFKLATETLEIALKDFVQGREKEGQALQQMIAKRCDEMTSIIKEIETHRPLMMQQLEDKWRKTLQEKMSKWAEDIEQGRLEQEMAIIVQKLDVDEEFDRLHTHLKEVKDVLNRNDAVGRRLDFLMQELNREANTLSSKSHDSKTTQLSVDLKVLIEQMREQIQNIE